MNSLDKLAARCGAPSSGDIARQRRREKLRQKYARRDDGTISLGAFMVIPPTFFRDK